MSFPTQEEAVRWGFPPNCMVLCQGWGLWWEGISNFLTSLTWLVSYLPWVQEPLTCVLISHKRNWTVYCCWIGMSCREGESCWHHSHYFFKESKTRVSKVKFNIILCDSYCSFFLRGMHCIFGGLKLYYMFKTWCSHAFTGFLRNPEITLLAELKIYCN